MSISLIQESAKEVRRLAIAGSPLAVGDFRMKKLIAPLEQAGTKVPVFAQVAKAISELVNGTPGESPTRLLSLSTLLNAILYTQGQTGTEGDFSHLEVFPTKCSSTRTAARVLKPLIAALTNAGGGRFELIKEACDRGAFNDLRLVDSAIQALGDSYPELADLVAERILPAYGPGIIPRLKATFELKGKKQDARKLGVMHQLDSEGTLELCKTALDEGSAEVKAAAIACLGKHEDCLPLVMAQANSKNKTLRAAALEALAEHDRPEVMTLFGELIKGKTLDILIRPFRAVRNRQVLNSLLEEGKRVLGLLVKGEAEQIQRFAEVLECLNERKDAEIEEFLLTCFAQCEKLGKLKVPKAAQFTVYVTGADLMERLALLLHEFGSQKALDAVLAKREALGPGAFNVVLQSALRIWPAEKVYQEFAPLLEQKKGGGKEKSAMIEHTFRASCGGYVSDAHALEAESGSSEASAKVQWDPRWLDAAIQADQQVIVCCLAKPGHAGAVSYLLKALEAKGQTEAGLLIRALAKCEYSKITDAFLGCVAKKTKGARYLDYELQLLFSSARHLPAADLPKLDAFAAKLDEKFVDSFLEALGPLRPVPQKPQ